MRDFDTSVVTGLYQDVDHGHGFPRDHEFLRLRGHVFVDKRHVVAVGLLLERHRAARGFDLALEVRQWNNARITFGRAQRYRFVKDVARQNFLIANRCANNAALLRETTAALDVELMFVAQATHQPTTRARNLRRIERQLLILRDREINRTQIRQPRRRTVFAATTTDA